jgi:hypothetical protein
MISYGKIRRKNSDELLIQGVEFLRPGFRIFNLLPFLLRDRPDLHMSLLKNSYMSENTTNNVNAAGEVKSGAEKIAESAGNTWDATKEKIEKVTDELGDKAEELWDKAKSGELTEEAKAKLKDIGEGAEKVWDQVEGKAGELWDKTKSGELADEAKAKLGDLAEGAKGLWNKLVDKLDGDEPSAGEPEKKA